MGRLIGIVEEGEERVVLALADLVVLVVVALGTAHRQPEPDAGSCVDPVEDRLDAKLFLVDAALGVRKRLAMEGGGQAVGGSCAREQVAGQLLDRELDRTADRGSRHR